MRDHVRDFQDKGAGLFAIGMGLPAMAAEFREQYRIPFPVLIDTKKDTYKALGLQRGTWNDILGPKLFRRVLQALRFGVGKPPKRQNPRQLGGAAVVGRDGSVRYLHQAVDSADHAPLEALLAAIP